uniref:Cytochrome c oxidase polypeptide VIa n=1 Tax=Ailuropoda melanoleuca TaxID=9646 RepID=A0A7N5KGT5_AILME
MSLLLPLPLPLLVFPLSLAVSISGSGQMWKALSYFVVLPGVGVSVLNVFLKSHHGKHQRPKFMAYPHLHIRSKPFPWGDDYHTLFPNSCMNPLPTSYEDQ